LDQELREGRRLFHAFNTSISNQGSLACATCHPDGREDGLVWRLRGERRQTPMLAGRLQGTAPYNWLGSTRTLEDNIAQTITRLGGTGLPLAKRRALARYLSQGLLEPVRPPPRDPALVARGAQVFGDPKVGCATCHPSEGRFSDGARHDVETTSPSELAQMRASQSGAEPQAFDTPSLRFVGLTPPYFHDGRASTLDEALTQAQGMGDTSGLTPSDRQALLAYLRSL
jgi:cytochrome c peroxidase